MDKIARRIFYEENSKKRNSMEHYMIYQIYGIELTWGEKAALHQYLESNKERYRRDRLVDNWQTEGINQFMREYFDIETTEVGFKGRRDLLTGKVNDYGMKLTGTPEFKEYCRERVQMWRDERNLI